MQRVAHSQFRTPIFTDQGFLFVFCFTTYFRFGIFHILMFPEYDKKKFSGWFLYIDLKQNFGKKMPKSSHLVLCSLLGIYGHFCYYYSPVGNDSFPKDKTTAT